MSSAIYTVADGQVERDYIARPRSLAQGDFYFYSLILRLAHSDERVSDTATIMKKAIVIVAAILVGLAGLMWWGFQSQTAGDQKNSGSISSLSSSEKLYDFGTISMKNGAVSHVFKIVNLSNKDIYVKKVATSCMCTTAYLANSGREKGPFGMEGMGYVPPANETIKAGESRDVRVAFDPNAHGPAGVGEIDRLVYLTDASGGTLQLEIKAVVTP